MPSILISTRLPSSAVALLTAIGDVEMGDAPLSRARLLERVAGKDALLSLFADRIDDELLGAAGPSLKIVANVAVGYDNIDLAAARARGVVITNTPDVLTESVVELTWAMIFGIARRLGEGERLVRRGGWKGGGFDFLLGTELRGKQLGIIGAGRIGRAVAAVADVFGMSVGFYDVAPSEAALSHGRALSFEELLRTSDVVSVHVPLRPETRHLIDRKALTRMKRSAYLINTSRGPVVDEAALAWALGEHLIAGAALDVYEQEPQVHPDLIRLENVMLIPHLGSATHDARTAMAELAARNVVAVLSGRRPLTEVPR